MCGIAHRAERHGGLFPERSGGREEYSELSGIARSIHVRRRSARSLLFPDFLSLRDCCRFRRAVDTDRPFVLRNQPSGCLAMAENEKDESHYEPNKIDLLIVDDDTDFRGTLVRRFMRRGFQVQEAATGEEALGLSERRQYNVAIVDMMMPGMSGIELLSKLRVGQSDIEVIILTGQGSIDTAVQAMKLGAYDYLTKPFPLAELELLIQKAYERHQLRKENRQLKAVLEKTSPSGSEMIGNSPAMQEVFRLIERAGPTDRAILIQGESGTGKELVARSLHQHSPRAEKPLVVINCAALPETLLESELFGHEKGSVTGAVAAKP